MFLSATENASRKSATEALPAFQPPCRRVPSRGWRLGIRRFRSACSLGGWVGRALRADSAWQEREGHCRYDADEGGQMIPAYAFAEISDEETAEYGECDHFLNDL